MTLRAAVPVAVLLAVLPYNANARQLQQDALILVPLSESNGVGNGNSALLSYTKRVLQQHVPRLGERHPAKWSPP